MIPQIIKYSICFGWCFFIFSMDTQQEGAEDQFDPEKIAQLLNGPSYYTIGDDYYVPVDHNPDGEPCSNVDGAPRGLKKVKKHSKEKAIEAYVSAQVERLVAIEKGDHNNDEKAKRFKELFTQMAAIERAGKKLDVSFAHFYFYGSDFIIKLGPLCTGILNALKDHHESYERWNGLYQNTIKEVHEQYSKFIPCSTQ